MNSKGSATILSLLISAIILTVSIGFNWFVKEHIKAAEALKYKTEAMINANSAFETLIYCILGGTFSSKEVMLYNGKKLFGIDTIPLNGTAVTVKEKNIKITLKDSNGLISLTSLYDTESIGRLIKIFYPDKKDIPVFIASLRDWVDRDDLLHINGAESFYYRSQDKSYSSRNYPLQYIEELAFIKGMEDVSIEKILPFITLLPNSGFNPNTAPDEVLLAHLDITKETLEAVKAYRANKEITSNSEVFMLTGKNLPFQAYELNNFSPSRFWDVNIRYEKDNKSIYFIESGLNTSLGLRTPFSIFYWKEG
ncbi:MAG TPA: hypothetical protein HPP56_02650 [Nitrospirae bacterium]|nr:hypothetical protein [Nitrospirota bacterium]